MSLPNPEQLANRYHGMRHGFSQPNSRHEIVSEPEAGVKAENGLTSFGDHDAYRSADESDLTCLAIIFSSDFRRALETALTAREVLGSTEQVQITELLRERFLGEWEGTSSDNYSKVWERDRQDADHTDYGVESVNSVIGRTVGGLILKTEASYTDTDIVLVSHGDTLQITQTWFSGTDPRHHRDVPHWEPAEIRLMNPAQA